MQPWIWAVLFCAAALTIGYAVDRRARAKRAGLVRPADTKGRSKADPVVQARIDHPGSAGIAQRQQDGGAGTVI
ncbi:hypothetical protein IOD16_30200 [Saccharothrix sp. 6-C]|uniref:hypothetical protein n=1 Tax=Saccharothrix sp. 6-C TaxID=2781735 RepID=UPI0019175EEE|nr:hypothetical protein [Saccharothrix sp. 6-C]QQQ75336.1 hypothetical protein IOD16_30200 [Saccharothrix sp. 6-C]